jgi:hypothetical protein
MIDCGGDGEQVSSNIPKACPTQEQIQNATSVYRDWLLHYYQLLWFHDPKLTAPGRDARPLSVEFDPDHIACLRVAVPQNPDFSFLILSHLNSKTQDEYDAEFMRKANTVVSAVSAGRSKVDMRACCPLAVIRGCVCAISFSCELHGQRCIGTHD